LELQELRRRLLLAADGLTELDEALASKGFLAHRVRRDWYAAEARSEEERTNLCRYWAETARECLGAAGGRLNDPIRRRLPPDALYRSAFLDELFAKQSLSKEFTRDDDLILDIEPCHGRIHQRIRNGVLPPSGYEQVKDQVRRESEDGQEVLTSYLDSPRLGSDFREMLSDVTVKQVALGVQWRHRGSFRFIEWPIHTLKATSAYLCHESDRPVRVGQFAFYVAFAKPGAKIIPSQPPEVI